MPSIAESSVRPLSPRGQFAGTISAEELRRRRRRARRRRAQADSLRVPHVSKMYFF